MTRIQGQSVKNGIAIGKIQIWNTKKLQVTNQRIEDTEEETKRFLESKAAVLEELKKLQVLAKNKIGEEEAGIFEAHEMILEDLDFQDMVLSKIKEQKLNAEAAVEEAGQELAAIFQAMEDNDYMNQRAADFMNVSSRVVQKLQNCGTQQLSGEEPVILLAQDLTPAETVQMDQSRLLSFVTTKGSKNSHTAILARSLNITSLVNTQTEPDPDWNEKMGIVDGFSGTLYIDPEKELLEDYMAKKTKLDQENQELSQMIGKETVTRSGERIALYANIGSPEDAKKALEYDAEGIGLFRSEFLYIGRQTPPTEDEQFESYRQVLETMGEKEVIIRTMDIGADKKADYFEFQQEENPALGLRGIRLCLEHPDIFKTQLRALYRASAYGNLSVMFPMITSVEEITEIFTLIEQVKAELLQQGVPFGQVRTGVMIETPAAALISDRLAEKVDFFSIGSNDLTQYTLAMDRQNASLGRFLNIYHQAVLNLIELTVRNAHKKNVTVGICGELGADYGLTEYFIKIGVDELSVSAPSILGLRRKIRESAWEKEE